MEGRLIVLSVERSSVTAVRIVTQFTAAKLCKRKCKNVSYYSSRRCRTAFGGNLVCQREGRKGVTVGEILGVSEGGEDMGEGGEILGV